MSDSSDSHGADRRLNTWKEIAAFFGKDERTVRRWEATRDLPVRRIPGGARNSVFAYVSELESWLLAEGPAPEVTAMPTAPASRPGRRDILIGAGIGAAVAVAGVAFTRLGWGLLAPSPGASLSTEIENRYAQGVYLWEKRTPESLREARAVFEQIVAQEPGFARGYTALANTYNLLREYSAMPSSEAYAAAARAAREAVRLEPNNAEAQSALAFAEFYGLRQVNTGLARLELALRAEPSSARIHHWYGNALMHLGRFQEALAEIETAQRLEPASRSILASKGLALLCAGHLEEAATLLTDLSRREPGFFSPVYYLSFVDLKRGEYSAWLDRIEEAGTLREDRSRIAVAAAGRLGLSSNGFRGMILAMKGEEEQQIGRGGGLIYNLARMEALLGEGKASVRSLRQSIAVDEEMAMGINIDPAFANIQSFPDFRTFGEELGVMRA